MAFTLAEKMRTILLLSLVLLSSCKTYDLNDQKMSMLSSNVTLIDRELESVRLGEKTQLSPRAYLRKFNAITIGGHTKPPRPTIAPDGNGGFHVTVETESALEWGSAALVSEDGYFLTANHVVDEKKVWIVFVEEIVDIPNQKTIERFSISSVRTVFSNKKADFAIIKAPFKGPKECLDLREEPINKRETIFSGGRLNETGAGYYDLSFIYGKKIYDGYEFHETPSTIPTLPGDSGSAAIDNKGRIFGIHTGSSARRSIFVMLNPKETIKIIEKDRIDNKSADIKDDTSIWEVSKKL
ncbi:serine protease [Pelagicoccus sp. SDUM812003]|uniref:S1 family peptidase n=1 Tax=Pelagicoccus sp. SDUM812003 TaxID=3041267 RepID=UPI00280DAC4F|nr:serine protease [Pelagicoccus sp. SDUM812003]MDQ8202702.1 serine protease [Pelagicoccus sp. SDUM812003]